MDNTTILVVDDERTNRIVIGKTLTAEGYRVVEAVNGAEAIEIFQAESPDIVLMDIMMPEMDGYEATRRIKSISGDNYVPVIFITAVTDEKELSRCIECGGDDFISKPFSRIILLARIRSHLRLRKMHQQNLESNCLLLEHNRRIEREQHDAERVFKHIIHSGDLDEPGIRYLLSPRSLFNGDILQAKYDHDGSMNILIADATGHGLPAAMGTLPVIDLFYNLVDMGACTEEIIHTINRKLCDVLPVEYFVCLCLVRVCSNTGRMEVWNGAMPEVIVFSTVDGKIKHRLESHSIPLGIVENDKINMNYSRLSLEEGDRVYLYSDGILEEMNGSGEMFGHHRLDACFTGGVEDSNIFDRVLSELMSFTGGKSQHDDISLLEYSYK